MKIYTRTGDKGDTSLFGGQRVPKDALRIEAYGTVDELNSVLGIVRADNHDPEIDRLLARIQDSLFVVGADLATPIAKGEARVRRIAPADAAALEQAIDDLDSRLPPLRTFVLPGGSPVASRLHFARTVCRRAERHVVRLLHAEEVGEAVLVYLNRLSDFLFVLARFANHQANVAETPWKQ